MSIFANITAPKCFEVFVAADELTYTDFAKEYLAKGYSHLISAKSSDAVTCGRNASEYRHRWASSLFFKGEAPQWEVLSAGGYQGSDPVIVLEHRKFVNRTSGNSQLYVGEFSGSQLAEWIAYWRCCETKRAPLVQ